MAADLRIRWHLELVDDASSRLLRQDRQIRTSLGQTERARKSLATTAIKTGNTQLASAVKVAGALRDEGKAAGDVQRDVLALNRAQAAALGVGDRLATSARGVATAYRTQAAELRGVQREQRKLASSTPRAPRAAAAAGGTASHLSTAAAAGAGRLAATAGAGGVAGVTALGAGFVVAERQVAGFDATLDGARGKLLVTKKAMEPLRELAIKLGADTNFSARQAASAIDELAAQGFSVNKILKILPGTLSLAAASGADFAQAATIQTETLHAFGLEAKDAGKVADVLAQISNRSAAQIDDLQESLKYIAPVAKASGQSLEDMGAAVGILANVGIKGSQAGTTLRTAMVRLSNPTDKARDALGKLHLTAGDLTGPKGLLSLPNILGKLAKGSEGVSKNQRNSAIATIFGREALSGMVALLEKGEPAIRKESAALKDSEGAAKRAANIMRDNVSGAWDNFTGSVESATIGLLTRFQPAIKDTLNDLGDFVDKGAKLAPVLIDVGIKNGKGLLEGLRGQAPAPVTRNAITSGVRAPLATLSTAKPDDTRSKAQKIGDSIRGVVTNIATVAQTAGKQLLDAFKPALPFFQNILLPLFKGIGLGILGSVVSAFKVLVPVIKIVATALGFIGTVAKPLAPVFEGIGKVIGFVFGGPILKGIGLLGKLGGVLRVVGVAAKVFATPLSLINGALGIVFKGLTKIPGALSGLSKVFASAGRAVGKLPGALAGGASAMLHAAGSLATAAAKGLANMPARLAVFAVSAAHAVSSRLGRLTGLLVDVGIKAAQGLVKTLKDGLSKLPKTLGDVVGGLASIGRDIVGAVIRGIKASPGAIVDAVKSLVPGPLRGAVSKLGLRRGGKVPGFAAGGVMPAAVSPGELVMYGNSSWTVPGSPVAADSVLTMLPAGAEVYTSSGQAMLASGATRGEALNYQAPHFRAGGVMPGKYVATAYGPPWGGINGGGVTATGVNLKARPHIYGMAVDPKVIPLGSRAYAWPNPFGYNGRFQAFDTGSAIKGNRVDFYDWRGTNHETQNAFGRKSVTLSNAPIRGRGDGRNTYTAKSGSGKDAGVSILGPSTRRAGGIADAYQQGITAGAAGVTRATIRKTGNPIIDAIREQAGAVDKGSSSLSQKYDPSSSSSSAKNKPDALRSIAAGLRVPYVWGGGHGGFSKSPAGLDCSGYVSNVLHYGKANPLLKAPTTTTGLAKYGVAGSGRRVTIHVRTKSPAHAMLTIDGHGYSSGNRSTGRKSGRYDVSSSYLSTLPIKRHPKGLRRGGIVGFRTGGTFSSSSSSSAGSTLTRGVTKALTFAGGSLAALDELVGAATQARIEALRTLILAKVKAGGPAKVVARYQSVLDLVDYELGRRIGELQDKVEAATRTGTRAAGQTDRDLRRAGIDPGSTSGLLTLGARSLRTNTNVAKSNVANLTKALAQAKKHGDQDTIRTLTQSLEDAQDALDEALVAQVENARAIIRQQAQDRVDDAGLKTDLANANLSTLDAFQRTNNYSDSAAAIGQRGDWINSLLIPALTATREALIGQLNAAAQTGDSAGVRAAQSAILSNGVDLANAVADAAEAVRSAATKAAQDLVDWRATYTQGAQNMIGGVDVVTRLASLSGTAAGAGLGANLGVGLNAGLNGVIGGYFPGLANVRAGSSSAMSAQASAIQTWLIPSLQAQATAIQGKLDVARTNGTTADIRSAELELQQNANDLATAVADAGELLRDAAVKAADDLVADAGHASNLADAGLQRLELEQKLAGSYETGGQARGDYITGTVIPALQAELASLQERERVQAANGLLDDLKTTIENEAAKSNEILQAQLDAQEETAANTAPRKVGGTLGFGFGDLILTDTLAGSFNGA